MKSIILNACLLGSTFCFVSANPVSADDHSKHFVVGGGGSNCPNANFAHIQEAVTQTPPGSVIYVCPGLYPESIVISNSVTLIGDPAAVIMPASIPPVVQSLTSANQLAPIIFVHSANDVDIEGFVVDGGATSTTQCSPNLIGILYQNASGSIKRSSIRNTKLSANLSGCQSGLGIFVQSGNGGESEVVIAENQVRDFQKNGITANEDGTEVRIENNIVMGLGPTSGAAQNGIQIGYGARGAITHNFVANNIWSPCVAPSQCVYFATGILVEQSNGVQVQRNLVGGNQINIFVNGDNAEIEGNQLHGSVTLDSIQIAGSGALVKSNEIVDSARAGLSVLANNVGAIDNEFVSAPIGIFVASGVTGFYSAGNDFDDVDTPKVDPPASAVSMRAYSPFR